MSIPREHQWPSSRPAARNELKQWREQLSPSEHRTLSEQLGAHVQACLSRLLAPDQAASGSALVLAVFWPIRQEPDFRPFFDDWRRMGFELALPVTPSTPGPLQFARWFAGASMARDSVGITVPSRIEPVLPRVVLLPCLGFTRDGYRLGYGGGYYDRTLPVLDSFNIGVAFAPTELSRFEPGNHDRPLDQVITEQGPVLART